MWVLIIAFLTVNGNSGLTMTSAVYSSHAACEAAGKAAKDAIAGALSAIRYSCSPQ